MTAHPTTDGPNRETADRYNHTFEPVRTDRLPAEGPLTFVEHLVGEALSVAHHHRKTHRMQTRNAALTAALSSAVMFATAGQAHGMTNGVPVSDPKAAPWVATLAPVGDKPMITAAGCGGALVAPDRVLTTARCVDGIDPGRQQVHVNAGVLSRDPGEVRGIRSVAVMPGYQQLPSPAAPDDRDFNSVRYDLAVIVLDKPVTDIQPLAIARHRTKPGTRISLFAHGLTGRDQLDRSKPVTQVDNPVGDGSDTPARPDNDNRNDTLHRGDLTTIPASACTASTPATVDADSSVCAQDLTAGVTGCWLDAGSPGVAFVNGMPELVGIYSFGGETAGKDCTPPAPAVFADAPSFRRWILGSLPERAAVPRTRPTVSRSGNTLHCTVPEWDTGRGDAPSSVTVSWVALQNEAPDTRELPIDPTAQHSGPDAAVRGAQLVPAPDLNLAGNQVACVVGARNTGGYVRVVSDPVGI